MAKGSGGTKRRRSEDGDGVDASVKKSTPKSALTPTFASASKSASKSDADKSKHRSKSKSKEKSKEKSKVKPESMDKVTEKDNDKKPKAPKPVGKRRVAQAVKVLAGSNWLKMKEKIAPVSTYRPRKKRPRRASDADTVSGAAAGGGAGHSGASAAGAFGAAAGAGGGGGSAPPSLPTASPGMLCGDPSDARVVSANTAYVMDPFPRSDRGKGLVRTAVHTDLLAIDCEMVGVGYDNRSALAEVCIVNYDGFVLYHRYVKPVEQVSDYRTHVSGIRAKDLKNATPFQTVQKEVADIIKGCTLVGHGLKNDLDVLMLPHNRAMQRDTTKYPPLCRITAAGKHRPNKLKNVAKQHLGVDIQGGEHSPAEDARASMLLYRKFAKAWEDSMAGVKARHSASVAKVSKKSKAKKQGGALDPSSVPPLL